MKTLLLLIVVTSSIIILIYNFIYHDVNQFGMADKSIIPYDNNRLREICTKRYVDELNETTHSIILLKEMLIDKNIENEILRRQLDELKRKLSGYEGKEGQMVIKAKNREDLDTDRSELTINSGTSKTDLNTKSHEIVYKVQIMTSGTCLLLNSKTFNGLNDVWEYKQDNLYKYTVGNEFDLNSASKLQSEIRNRGFLEAFVVAFKDGERIPVREAVLLD